MPTHAERLAKRLIEDADVDPLIVEVPHEPLCSEVVQSLEEMGYLVVRDPSNPLQLEIHLKRV